METGLCSRFETQYLQSDVEGRVSCSGLSDAPDDLLCSQRLHVQRLQSPRSVRREDIERRPSSQLRESGPQQVQEVRLLQTTGTLQLLHPTFLKHWKGKKVVRQSSPFQFHILRHSFLMHIKTYRFSRAHRSQSRPGCRSWDLDGSVSTEVCWASSCQTDCWGNFTHRWGSLAG